MSFNNQNSLMDLFDDSASLKPSDLDLIMSNTPIFPKNFGDQSNSQSIGDLDDLLSSQKNSQFKKKNTLNLRKSIINQDPVSVFNILSQEVLLSPEKQKEVRVSYNPIKRQTKILDPIQIDQDSLELEDIEHFISTNQETNQKNNSQKSSIKKSNYKDCMLEKCKNQTQTKLKYSQPQQFQYAQQDSIKDSLLESDLLLLMQDSQQNLNTHKPQIKGQDVEMEFDQEILDRIQDDDDSINYDQFSLSSKNENQSQLEEPDRNKIESLEKYGIDKRLIDIYKNEFNINQLFDWQIDCFSQ